MRSGGGGDVSIDLLREVLAEAGIPAFPGAVSLLALHANEMLRWNRSIRLTAITDPVEVAVKHVADSLLLLRFAPFPGRILDFGSGAGYPGIPLALYLPGARVTVLEASVKKCAFLSRVRGMLRAFERRRRTGKGGGTEEAPPSPSRPHRHPRDGTGGRGDPAPGAVPRRRGTLPVHDGAGGAGGTPGGSPGHGDPQGTVPSPPRDGGAGDRRDRTRSPVAAPRGISPFASRPLVVQDTVVFREKEGPYWPASSPSRTRRVASGRPPPRSTWRPLSP